MKQQRRHELQTNQLADQLGHYLEDIRPYFNHILIGLLAVAALIIVMLWWKGSNTRSLGASWSDYFEAAATREATAMSEVTKLHPGTQAAVWAHLSAADMQYAKGAGLLFRDREEAQDLLKEAEQHYLAAVDGGADKFPWLMARAQFGLGQVYESQSELDQAIGCYQRAAGIDADSVIGKTSKERAELLAQADTKGWYNWFSRQEPPTPGEMPAGSGLGPDLPGSLDSLPSSPDLPMSIDAVTPGDLTPDDTDPVDMDLTAPDTTEASGPDPNAEATEADTPAPEKPAESSTPADPEPPASPEPPAAPDAGTPAADSPTAPEAPASAEENN